MPKSCVVFQEIFPESSTSGQVTNSERYWNSHIEFYIGFEIFARIILFLVVAWGLQLYHNYGAVLGPNNVHPNNAGIWGKIIAFKSDSGTVPSYRWELCPPQLQRLADVRESFKLNIREMKLKNSLSARYR